MKSQLCILILTFLSAPHLGKGEIALLAPSADAGMHQSDSLGNFGASNTMISGKLGDLVNGEIRHALLRFDLSGIPAQALVTEATLRVTVTRIPDPPADSTFDLRRVLQDWSETSVSWDNRLSLTPWAVPGATGANDVVDSASASVPVSGINT